MTNDEFYNAFKLSFFNENLVAINYFNENITYKKLLDRVAEVSMKLPRVDYIILNCKKNIDFIVLLLACIKNGIVFVPVPHETPKLRIDHIKNDLEKMGGVVEIINDLNKLGDLDIKKDQLVNKVSYIIYTSGSTGAPKGVMVGFEGFYNIIKEQVDEFKMNEDRFMWLLSTGFDASLSDIFVTLFSGSTLIIPEVPLDDLLYTSKIHKAFNDKDVTVSDIPPSVLKRIKPEQFKSLKKIIVGGEVAPVKSLKDFNDFGIEVFNVYGPTEATICSSISKYSNSFISGEIGLPVNKMNYLIDVSGELLISGVGLAIGYTNKKLTNEKFIKKEGVRFYKSGDLVSLENGVFIFKGRVDRQFKRNGQLICPEEIEKEILNIYEVNEASVYFDGSINALISLRSGCVFDKDALLIELSKKLPSYMLPNSIKVEGELEKNSNGKTIFIKNDNVLNKVRSIYEKILKKDIHDDNERFYNLGGDSLLFMDVLIELEKCFVFDIFDLLSDDSVNGVSKVINKNKSENLILDECIPSPPVFFESVSDTFRDRKKYFYLTGVTGFLGIHLLSELVSKGCRVVCLVRASSVGDALERLLRNANKYNLTIDLTKVSVVLGDIELECFGMNSNELDLLKSEVTDIVHCAALVNNLSSLESAIRTNVNPVKFLIEFANMGVKKRIHNMSTLSIFVSSKNSPAIISEEMGCNEVDLNSLYTTYAQSKWLTEFYLDRFSGDLDVVNYRLGLLTPSLACPFFNDRDYLRDVFKILVDTKTVAKVFSNLSFDITPVDLASSKIVDIIMGNNVSENLHITTNQKVSFKDLQKVFKFEFINDVIEIDLNKYGYEIDGRNPFLNIFETTRVKSFNPSVIFKINKLKYLKAYGKGVINV
jgi:thioester reductase-like protein/acyl-coenzyme A synthetase/AMP-(fatty) acid ligase/acyl carrier protein